MFPLLPGMALSYPPLAAPFLALFESAWAVGARAALGRMPGWFGATNNAERLMSAQGRSTRAATPCDHPSTGGPTTPVTANTTEDPDALLLHTDITVETHSKLVVPTIDAEEQSRTPPVCFHGRPSRLLTCKRETPAPLWR